MGRIQKLLGLFPMFTALPPPNLVLTLNYTPSLLKPDVYASSCISIGWSWGLGKRKMNKIQR